MSAAAMIMAGECDPRGRIPRRGFERVADARDETRTNARVSFPPRYKSKDGLGASRLESVIVSSCVSGGGFLGQPSSRVASGDSTARQTQTQTQTRTPSQTSLARVRRRGSSPPPPAGAPPTANALPHTRPERLAKRRHGGALHVAPRVLDATSSDRLRTAITAPQVWQQLSPEDRRRVQSMLAAAGADGWYLDWYGRLVRSVRGARRVTCFVLCGDAGLGIA